MSKAKSYLLYFCATCLSLLALSLVFLIYKVSPLVPLNYQGDAIVHYNFAKNIQETGWWSTNPHLGSPLGQNLYDFPLTENIQLALIKLFIELGLGWILSVNALFLLSFPLTVLTSLLIMRKMGVQPLIAAALSLLYSFLPYHFLRGVTHLFLATYFVIPLSVYVAYRLAVGNSLKLAKLMLAALIISASGAYYTFFSLLLLFPAGVHALLNKPVRVSIKYVSLTLGLILCLFLINYLPSYLHIRQNGENLNSVARKSSDTEIYGLKVVQLLLPFEDHNFGLFNKIQKRYLSYGSAVSNENQDAALGIIASLGFVFLLIWTIFKPGGFSRDNDLEKKLDILGSFNIVILLFSIVGGFSSILSTYVNPTFRSNNRISVVIAFISLTALGLAATRVKNKVLVVAIATVVLVLGLYDQVSLGVMRNLTQAREDYPNLVSFANGIKGVSDKNAKIFSLPVGLYPEGSDKDIIRIALLTENIYWSAGSEKWRSANYWQHEVSKMDSKSFIAKIIKEGYSGLLVNTKEFNASKLTEIEKELAAVPLQDPKKEYRFYNLQEYTAKNNISVSPSKVFFHIAGSCLYDQVSKYYCVNSGRVELDNISPTNLNKTLKYTIDLPEGTKEERRENINVEVGRSHYTVTPNSASRTFSIPQAIPTWPINLGYPNFVLSNVTVL